MGKSLDAQHSNNNDETLLSTLSTKQLSASQSPIGCYWLQKSLPSGRYIANKSSSAGYIFSNGTPDDDDFIVICPEAYALPENLLKEIASLSDTLPELNCYLISLVKNALPQGLQNSSALFQKLHEQGLWQHDLFAVVLRAAQLREFSKETTLQDVMLMGLLNTQSVWVVQQSVNESPMNAQTGLKHPVSYQQFISDYERLTRLTQFIPEKNHVREIYLRHALTQLMRDECSQQRQLSANVQHAIDYFGDKMKARNYWEKLMLKQPVIFFTLMKLRRKLQPQYQF
ncbi:hypothetical protein [Pantoea sp. MQR6]|uniref:hypothetical protein n=1 Tax=Pantoea sp. MQR6 TaxID=2907307 RepID=UPI001FA95E05|nr:hypothetical protein [Pantoea sp. MQR6]